MAIKLIAFHQCERFSNNTRFIHERALRRISKETILFPPKESYLIMIKKNATNIMLIVMSLVNGIKRMPIKEKNPCYIQGTKYVCGMYGTVAQ